MEISTRRYLILERTNDKKNCWLHLLSTYNDIVDDHLSLVYERTEADSISFSLQIPVDDDVKLISKKEQWRTV